MRLSAQEISEIKSKVLSKIMFELDLAITDDNIEEFLNKHNIIFEANPMPVQPRTMKILVLGALSGNVSNFKLAAKKLGIGDNHIKFECDYKSLKRYDVSRLEYSNEYSDIIFGPNPHKQIGIGDYASALSMMKSEPEKYPRIIESIANNSLKITISSFKEAILNTRYYETIQKNY